jgi:hypothetical protein
MADRVATLTIPIESRATVEAKALRIILERRLTILMVKGDRVYAECRGTDKVHHPAWIKGRWVCDCDGHNRCSHLAALMHVVVRPDG